MSQPRDETGGVELRRVRRDGTVVIHVERTGETLAAKPGEPFRGRRRGPYNVRTFGERGLVVRSSDPQRQTAVLERRGARYD